MNSKRFVLPFVTGAMLVAVARSQCDLAAIPGDPVRDLRGHVDSLALFDPDGAAGPLPTHLVAGGTFDVGAVANEHVVMWNGSTWVNTNAPFGAVTAMVVWNNLLVAASEEVLWTFDGTTWSLLAGGEEGSPTAPLPGVVNALATWNGDLVVGGRFTRITAPFVSVNANHIARLNSATGWSAFGTGPTTTNMSGANVRALTVFNGTVWAGLGCNTNFSGTATLQYWNGGAWTAQPGWTDPIDALAARIGTAITNSWIFAAAHSLTTPTFTVAGFNPVLGTTNTFAAPPAAGVSKLEQIFVRGTGLTSYEVACTITTNGTDKVWRWTAAGGWVALPNLTDPDGAVTATRVSYFGGRYVAGFRCGGGAPQGLRSHDAALAQWVPCVGSGFDDGVNCVCPDGAELVIGGRFTAIGGTAASRIARGHAGAWLPLGSGFGPSPFGVLAVARLANGDLVAGGDFTSLGDGTPMSRIARWNGVAWSQLGGGVDGAVEALLPLPNGDLIVGGWFTTAGGQPASRIARWNGSTWAPLGAGCSSGVKALLLAANGDIVAGGLFLTAGGLTANGVARWTGASWSTFGVGFTDQVNALTETPNGIVAGGAFLTSGSLSTRYLARWTGSAWVPFGPLPLQPDRPVRALATLPGGEPVVGGASFTAGTAASTCAAVWRGNAWESLSVVGSEVRGMVMAGDGRLCLVGSFRRAGAIVSANVATIVSSCGATATTFAAGCAGSGGANTLTALTLPWANGTLRTLGTGLPADAIVLTVTSVTPVAPGVPLSLLFAEGGTGCNLGVVPDILGIVIPAAGAAPYELSLPDTPPIVGVVFYQQMIPIEFDPGTGAWVAVTATNSLRFTAGGF
ncbi:MAG: hypothetical protein JNK78_05205 [Planctomycetes bacterium]|nr:hypothetical protein [Planctomycetota bacterium]